MKLIKLFILMVILLVSCKQEKFKILQKVEFESDLYKAGYGYMSNHVRVESVIVREGKVYFHMKEFVEGKFEAVLKKKCKSDNQDILDCELNRQIDEAFMILLKMKQLEKRGVEISYKDDKFLKEIEWFK